MIGLDRVGDIVEQATWLQGKASDRGLKARLLGGTAVAAVLGDRVPAGCDREPGDIDVAIPGADRKGMTMLMEGLGYSADRHFNTLQGRERLLFYGTEGTRVDVVVDVLRMCHVIDLAPAFRHGGPTLPPWLLLVTKLQVVELTDKDRGDAAALLAGCELAELEVGALAKVCAEDWGLWRSVTGSLQAVLTHPPVMEPRRLERLRHTAAALRRALDEESKSLRWKMRARVGERVRWYELPEEP